MNSKKMKDKINEKEIAKLKQIIRIRKKRKRRKKKNKQTKKTATTTNIYTYRHRIYTYI